MRQRTAALLAGLCLALGLCACGAPPREESASAPQTAEETRQPAKTEETMEEEETMTLHMKIGETALAVAWEENESVRALEELCREAPLTIALSMYGGFEQVGPIGASLPRNDVQTRTEAGDIVLYSGSQLVVFYGSNSWAYTRLGHISDQSAAELAALLGNGDVTVCLWMEAER